ncbi:FREM2-like protein, partial [Mya arenaria]
TVYGRLDVSPIQLLDQNVYLYIEKVFVCAGQEGYIPLYNPDIGGCVGNPEQLDTVIRILDITDPSSVNTTFQGFPLSAMMSQDDTEFTEVFNIPGADGFSFDSSPLFKEDHIKRSLDDIAGVGNGEKGTNMAPLILNFNGKSLTEDQYKPGKRTENSESQMPLLG